MKQDVYMNRELSWLKFNERVLEEAEKEQIHQILKAVRKLNVRNDAAYETLMEKLEEIGVSMVDFHCLSIEESAYLEVFFDSEILPLLSPTIVGKRQPFPFLKNREIYAVCVLQTKSGKEKLGIVPCSKEVFPELCPAGSVVCVPASGPSAHQTGIVF